MRKMLLKFTKTTSCSNKVNGSSSIGSSSSAGSSTSSITMPGTYNARGTGVRSSLSAMSTMNTRIHRKGIRIPSKRHPGKAFPGKLYSVTRVGPGKLVSGKRFPIRPHPPPCDNSNDSGFGFDQHVEIQQSPQQQQQQQHHHQHQLQQTNHIKNNTNANVNNNNNIINASSSTNIIHPTQQQQQQQQSQSQQQQQQQQQQQGPCNTSTLSGTSSTPSNVVALALPQQQSQPAHHQQQQQQQHHHQHHHHHHSSQQPVIRALPASRSRRFAKRLPFLDDDDDDDDDGDDNDDDNDDDDENNTKSDIEDDPIDNGDNVDNDEEFITDDSDDNGVNGARKCQHKIMSNLTKSLTSSSMTTQNGCSMPKRKKLATTPIDLLDNDDACSEDAFIHKIANATTQATVSAVVNGSATITGTAATAATVTERILMTSQLHGQVRQLPPPPPSLALQMPMSTSLVHPPIANSATKFINPNSRAISRVAHKRQLLPPPNSVATSSDGRIQLEIISQPEQQHRARYQTEGSRGAVKDRSGNGFPVVRLLGYNKNAVLQVFIGTDIGRVAPHMFYQACKVAGKNSTQCNEKKVDGTVVIEIDFKPEHNMTVTCDCVGILKERNVDVEHRFPDHLSQKNKKKSTRCRMVFRTQLNLDDGSVETLQVCSNPIICTQPPGVPEICKKSLNSCPVEGGLELFIIGKNFLKDTHVIFQEVETNNGRDELNCATNDLNNVIQTQLLNNGPSLWEQTVFPDKEYLQQNHLVCTVPPYLQQNIIKPITVQLTVISSGRRSESHSFVYTPKGTYTTLAAATCHSNSNSTCSHPNANITTTALNTNHTNNNNNSSESGGNGNGTSPNGTLSSTAAAVVATQGPPPPQFLDVPNTVINAQTPLTPGGALWPLGEAKHEIDADIMPPPITTQMPMGVRRPSLNAAVNNNSVNATTGNIMSDAQIMHMQNVTGGSLKTELMDENSQNSLGDNIHGSNDSNSTIVNCTLNGVAATQNANTIQYHTHYGRKATIETMMYESNSMPNFSIPNSASTTTTSPMEVAAVAAAVEMAVKNEIAKAVSVAKVDKFITDIAKSTDVVNAVASVPEPATLFDTVPNTTVTAIDHALTDILHQAGVGTTPTDTTSAAAAAAAAVAVAAVALEHGLSNSPNTASPALGNSPLSGSSPVSSLTGHNSPITQDIILNSEPAVALSAAAALPMQPMQPMQQLLPSGPSGGTTVTVNTDVPGGTTSSGLTTDIIMNPSVSPSTILCSDNGAATAVVPNIMTPHQVTMANSILNDIAMQPQPTQQDAAVAALAISNIIMTPSSDTNAVSPSAATLQPEVSSATSTAVSNMIIKAAADFISNQEQQQQQQQQQHHNQHQHQHQQQQAQQQQQQHQQQQQQQQQQSTSPTTPMITNLLFNHGSVTAAPQATVGSTNTVGDVSTQFPLGITTPPQESLIVALATENALQKSVTAAAITSNGAVVTHETPTTDKSLHPATAAAAAVGAVAVATAAAAAIPPAIPQELTTMSDQDLISYINPSTFDQV